jgi:P27 family predicted phage terminase small subunit
MANKPTGRKRGRPRSSTNSVEIKQNGSLQNLEVPTPPVLGPDGLELWLTIWTAGKQWLREDHDRELVTQACQIKDEIEQMRRALLLGEVKRTYVATNKQPTTHPYVNQIAAGRAQLISLLASLGMGPEARTRLGLVEAQSRNILTELQERSEKRRQEMRAANND